MKHLSITGMLLLMGIAGNAIAGGCSDAGYKSPLNGNSLSDKRVEAVAPGGEEWNEDHCSSGELYKLGDGTPVDPYALRGNWTSSLKTVTYNYTGDSGSPYLWTLWQNNASAKSICWEDSSGGIIATAPEPGSAGDCSVP